VHTPWGQAQDKKQLGYGVIQVTTVGHGGIHVSPTRNAMVHKAWREKGGWYEEDCDWAIVAITFPNLFSEEHRLIAHNCAKNWFPDEYEQVLGVALLPAESLKRREDLFYAAHADRWITTSAFGAGQKYGRHVPVPEGMVGVFAMRGRRAAGGEAAFLVPDAEYKRPYPFGFPIDEERHPAWPFTDGT